MLLSVAAQQIVPEIIISCAQGEMLCTIKYIGPFIFASHETEGFLPQIVCPRIEACVLIFYIKKSIVKYAATDNGAFLSR